MYMRGRPVVLYVPEKRADALNYDITKVQPAPSKKLKLDWVKIDYYGLKPRVDDTFCIHAEEYKKCSHFTRPQLDQ